MLSLQCLFFGVEVPRAQDATVKGCRFKTQRSCPSARNAVMPPIHDSDGFGFNRTTLGLAYYDDQDTAEVVLSLDVRTIAHAVAQHRRSGLLTGSPLAASEKLRLPFAQGLT